MQRDEEGSRAFLELNVGLDMAPPSREMFGQGSHDGVGGLLVWLVLCEWQRPVLSRKAVVLV